MNKRGEIPLTFRKNGFDYKLIKTNEMFAIYSQISKGVVVGHEIHKVRFWNNLKGKFTKLNGTYRVPSNEDFGTYGWSYETLGYVEEKYKERIENE